ncbi:hypothetical protein Tcan_17197 [Toxocara canis]|uniref:Uncharacterized protein n=1 Tax=Toxocara canis TaxID=6265 RepID=A0A0B2VES6_TOXCA|nr:hypothetical protein Tcan_17197 [Toxocara canis]
MPSGRDADIFHDENLWSEKLLEGKGESSATADSVRSRLANVFIDEDGIPSGMGSFSEQRSADTSSVRASETVIYSAPVFVLLRTQKTNISKGILGVAVLRSSTRTPEDELVLYTATKKVELRQKFHDSFCVLVSDQQVTFEDFFHNQWWLSFADFNTLLLFVVTVVRSVERQFGKRGLHVVRAGEGQEANVGDSVLFDMTKYTENSDGRLVELKRDVGMKMKITKKMTEPDQWQHVLVGMKRGCVRVIALPEFVICILLKKLKPAKGKSPEARQYLVSFIADTARCFKMQPGDD